MTLPWGVVAFSAVLMAELGADRSLISVTALSTRFGAGAVVTGLTAAFAAKSFVAVLLGRAITSLPAAVVTTVGTVALLFSAITIWRETRPPVATTASTGLVPSGTVAAFSSVFFAEWADPGQIATATLASQSGAPIAVWLGATLAMSTKGLIALGVGRLLHQRVPDRVLRVLATITCLAMAAAIALRIEW